MSKQVQAYNLCDGARTQSEIAKKLKLDSANLSKSIKRWVDLGIVIRALENDVEKPVHVYPVSEDLITD